jgi:hypothetical protein
VDGADEEFVVAIGADEDVGVALGEDVEGGADVALAADGVAGGVGAETGRLVERLDVGVAQVRECLV